MGSNRLGGNSLLDCVVFGRVSGRSAARYLTAANIKYVEATKAGTTAQATKKKAASASGDDYGLPGVLPPLGYFDPAGFATDIDKQKLLFYREAEIKHGRICMSASLGFLVAERWHPIYGGAIDVPSVAAGKDARLLPFWAAVF